VDAAARLDRSVAVSAPRASAPTRRRFVVGAVRALAGLALLSPRDAWAAFTSAPRRRTKGPHPMPRPGIDASKVLKAEQLTENPKAAPVFDMVRQIPQVADGIRCQCGCADEPGFYSLLSCYEADGMAQHCHICQGEARLAFTMHQQGKTLDEIRAAIDDRFTQ
jgi:hypothetical protein